MNEPIGRFGSRQTRARADDRLGDGGDGFVLTDDPLVQFFVEA